ncbi:MAG: hypothetical protein QM504_12345 [Pseudomonadota bacterium]
MNNPFIKKTTKQYTALNRLVTKEYPDDTGSASEGPKIFSDFLEVPNLILLGDPGAGKSFLFDEASQFENGLLLTARNFSIYANQSCTDKVLYIDALDENRSQTDSSQSIDTLIKLVNKYKPSKLRLSCRAADWLGETDLEVFKPYFDATGGYRVLSLEALTEEEKDQILHEKGINDPITFRKEAESRGVSFMLKNPQTLIMLIETIIHGGKWPETKKDLYKKSTEILLTEHNKNHARFGAGSFSVEVLFEAAGAACASLLISNVAGLNLLKSSLKLEFPSYTGIPYDHDAVLAALTRRIFIVSIDDSVNCTHRTIAEYLAACWLANLVRNGLPLNRIRSLICSEGSPVSELRGLHAWLATVLKEHAGILIQADPYGVLSYGDVASISPNDRNKLLDALVNLSDKDPWFRSHELSSEHLGALSGPDMVDSFKRILSTKSNNFYLRSIVLDAVKHGQSLPELSSGLQKILIDEKASYVERKNSYEALINVNPENIKQIVKAVRRKMKGNGTSVHLRASIISEIYEDNFSPNDVACLIVDVISDEDRHSTGELWFLPDSIPTTDIPEILNIVSDVLCKKNLPSNIHNKHEVVRCFSSFIVNVLPDKEKIKPKNLWIWLSALHVLNGRVTNTNKNKKIRAWIFDNNDFVLDLFLVALDNYNINNKHNLFWYDFSSTMMNEINRVPFAQSAFNLIKDNTNFTAKEKLIFDIVLSIVVNEDPTNRNIFEKIYDFGVLYPELEKILERECSCFVQDWRIENINNKIVKKNERQEGRRKHRLEFNKNINDIRSGKDLNKLIFVAYIYFSKFTDTDDKVSPEERVIEFLGIDLYKIAMEGLRSMISRSDLPSVEEVGKNITKNTQYKWWYCIIAGMDECWKKQPFFTAYPIETLKSCLAIDIACPTYHKEENTQYRLKYEWKDELFINHAELVQSVYIEIIRIELNKNKEHINEIHELCNDERLSHNRGTKLLCLLRDFPNAKYQVLKQLISEVISTFDLSDDLLKLALSVLSARSKVRKDQRAIWISIVFILSFNDLKDSSKLYLKNNTSAIWVLKSIINHAYTLSIKNTSFKLSIEQLAYLIALCGNKFKNVDHPRNGWSGENNPWDAAEFVRKLISDLSTKVDINAAQYLREFSIDSNFNTYKEHFKHALAQQESLRRQYDFIQPDWDATVETLSGGKPAHISDLHALTVTHLHELIRKIRFDNTDIYKAFWNEDSYGRIVDPKGEESCRDRLINILKPRFDPIEVHVEPEGHMANDKRADIVLLLHGKRLPLELKRDYHKDLWTACHNQLNRLYARDPEASGYGIYVIFWFGDKRTRAIPKPPQNIPRPKTPQELEDSLRSLILPDDQARLEVVVIDVSR